MAEAQAAAAAAAAETERQRKEEAAKRAVDLEAKTAAKSARRAPPNQPPAPPAPPAPPVEQPRRRKLGGARAFKANMNARESVCFRGAAIMEEPEEPIANASAASRFKVGDKVRALDSSGEAWVPGRLLCSRTNGATGRMEFKVSLDGYDSEEDVWREPGDERLLPYVSRADRKSGSLREAAAEAFAARHLSEQRRGAAW